MRAGSSGGRVSPWHGGGPGFKSRPVHCFNNLEQYLFFIIFILRSKYLIDQIFDSAIFLLTCRFIDIFYNYIKEIIGF